MTKIEYFYIRAQREDGSVHRVGIIGLGNISGSNSVYISGSFCSVDDQFNSADAIQKMENRMFFKDKCFKVPNYEILKKVDIYKVLDRLNFYQPACKQGVDFVDLEEIWEVFKCCFINNIENGVKL